MNQSDELIYKTDEEWTRAAQSTVEKFIREGSRALTPVNLKNLRLGLQGFAVQAKHRKELADHAKDTLIVVRAILNGIGGSVEH